MSTLGDYEIKCECSTCRFWHTAEVISTVIGQCRRHGPICRPDNPERIWPETRPADWCGEFLRKPASVPGWTSYPTQAYAPAGSLIQPSPPLPGAGAQWGAKTPQKPNILSAAKALFHKGP